MSHRWDCPSEWEARLAGEHSYERSGYRSYYTPERFEDCEDAARAYHDGQRAAERRAEERAEQEAWERQQEERRRWAMIEAQHAEEMEREYVENMWLAEIDEAIAEAWGDGP